MSRGQVSGGRASKAGGESGQTSGGLSGQNKQNKESPGKGPVIGCFPLKIKCPFSDYDSCRGGEAAAAAMAMIAAMAASASPRLRLRGASLTHPSLAAALSTAISPGEDAHRTRPGRAAGGWQLESHSTADQSSLLRVVLVSPQIPGNAGTTARTCAASAVPLHLVEPLGFEISDKRLKRAGLDYWDSVCAQVHTDWPAFSDSAREAGGRVIAFSNRAAPGRPAPLRHYDLAYEPGDWLCFGSEPDGLPDEFIEEAADVVVSIPQVEQAHVRSLNLAVAVGIGTYEALRQLRG